MKVEQVMMPTGTATSDMSVRAFIEECTRTNTPGLPYTTRSGRISGRVTLKNVFKLSCLPDYIVESARLLGDLSFSMEKLDATIKRMMESTVDIFVQEPHPSLGSDASALKALAMMEQNDTSYIFVVDEGQYRGVVTIQGLARKFAALDRNS